MEGSTMKYSSLSSHGEEEDNDVLEPPLTFVAPTCHERWVCLFSMMGFFMIVAALSLHDNKATLELRGSFMNQTEYGVDPCSFWKGDCPHDDVIADDLAALEAFSEEPMDLTYDEVVEQFSEHLDEQEPPQQEEEQQLQQQQQQQQQEEEEDIDMQGGNEMYGLEPMEVLYDQSRNENPSNSSGNNAALFSEDILEIPEDTIIARIEDEEDFGN